MTEDKGILIKNIYYMLAYAFQVLKPEDYESVASKPFEDAKDLFAAILFKGVSQQIKQGLYREYIETSDDLILIRGKVNIYKTAQNMAHCKKSVSCEYDELSENNIYNQIIKTTIIHLIRSSKVKKERKEDLKKILIYLGSIDEIQDLRRISWKSLKFERNNQSYKMLLYVCYFVISDLIQTTDAGQYKVAGFSDEHMETLYEKFILQYYRKHYPELNANPSPVKWDFGCDSDVNVQAQFPGMKTDITLFSKEKDKTLIIDAKYYGKIYQEHYSKQFFHSANIYQIYSYVKNSDVNHKGNVAGVLLYAQTTGEELLPGSVVIGGNRFWIKTLNLNCEFPQIEKQLNSIVEEFFKKTYF